MNNGCANQLTVSLFEQILPFFALILVRFVHNKPIKINYYNYEQTAFAMQGLKIKIEDSKFHFFLELIKNFDFIKIEDKADSSEAILTNIKEVKLTKLGKLKTTSAKEFLNEL